MKREKNQFCQIFIEPLYEFTLKFPCSGCFSAEKGEMLRKYAWHDKVDKQFFSFLPAKKQEK